MSTVQLRDLRRGRLFWLDGKRGKLLYCTPCRARVRLEPRQVTVKEATFERVVETDWAPTTLVEVRSNLLEKMWN